MNLNMQAFNINTLLGGLDKVRDVMGVYQQQLLLIVIVFALLNCFFGYALRKLWSVIPGFFLGAAAGYAAGTYTNQTTTITLALAVGTGRRNFVTKNQRARKPTDTIGKPGSFSLQCPNLQHGKARNSGPNAPENEKI